MISAAIDGICVHVVLLCGDATLGGRDREPMVPQVILDHTVVYSIITRLIRVHQPVLHSLCMAGPRETILWARINTATPDCRLRVVYSTDRQLVRV